MPTLQVPVNQCQSKRYCNLAQPPHIPQCRNPQPISRHFYLTSSQYMGFNVFAMLAGTPALDWRPTTTLACLHGTHSPQVLPPVPAIAAGPHLNEPRPGHDPGGFRSLSSACHWCISSLLAAPRNSQRCSSRWRPELPFSMVALFSEEPTPPHSKYIRIQ